MRLTQTAIIELENMIDHYGLAAVLVSIGNIASEKAAHIQENWQDDATARCWQRAATVIDKAADRTAEYVGD